MRLTQIGVDIEETDRFVKLKPTSSFTKMIFTPKEIDYCFHYRDHWTHLAARFAAKEAVKKAFFGFKVNSLGMTDIEVQLDSDGSPKVQLNKSEFKNYEIHLSLSHSSKTAISFVVVYKS